MKKNIKSKVKKPRFEFKSLLLMGLFCLVFLSVSGQQREYKIEKEVSFPEEGSIKINAPKSVRITGNGTISTRQVGDQYIVSRKDNTPPIYKIHKKLVLHTWDKAIIKQVSSLTFNCKTPEEEQLLKEALSINLASNAAGVVEIDCELNIAKFQVENGWFKEENNHIVLDNGRICPIEFLSISTTLYVPVNSQIVIDAEDTDLLIDRHEGELELNAVGGSFTAKEISHLKGSLQFVDLNIEHIEKATLSLKKSLLQAKSIHQLHLESSLSKLEVNKIEKLEIAKSMNDQFSLESVNSIKASNSLYSHYRLGSCTESLEMTLKSGDVDIKNLAPSLKFAVLKNQNAQINLDVKSLESYSLLINSFDQAEYILPNDLVLTNSEDGRKAYTSGSNPEKTKLQIDCLHCEISIK